MSSKARSMAREIARRGSMADFDDCFFEVIVEPLRDERRLCPKCRAAANATTGNSGTVVHEDPCRSS